MINHFNFRKIGNKYLITNDQGRYMFVTSEELKMLVDNNIDYSSCFGKEAESKLFCYDGSIFAFSDRLIPYYREAKNYLFSGTSLHIFVVTNLCNHDCIYCQAHTNNTHTHQTMSIQTAQKAVDIALSSPERYLTFEFQGGEPLLGIDIIKFIVSYATEQSTIKNKIISFNLVSNLSILTPEIADYLADNNINISTSLDGNCDLHCTNRPIKDGSNSFNRLISSLELLKSKNLKYGAIETTTKISISKSKELIDSYVQQGLSVIFLRSLTPLGCAKENWDEIGYTAEEFLLFYEQCLNYIIELNTQGICIKESYATLLLTKILTDHPVNYMELRSPCGAVFGQIAYNYDGNIYSCDEGRMIAEMGDNSFRIGNIDNTYDELIKSNISKTIAISSYLDSLPGCCDCVYSPYCGRCPVISFASQQNIYGKPSHDFKCTINRGILDTIFQRLQNEEIMKIFISWL